jgi:outer membrane protein
MKKIALIFTVLFATLFTANAQKFAIVDMEYIMKNIPAYETANEQLNQVSQKWQKEVEALNLEAQTLYKNYQTELVFMSPEMKTKRENEIVEKEKAAQDLKRKYFASDGELYKKRESLMKPIQDEVYNAIKALAEEKGYSIVLDKSSNLSLIYSSSKVDISDDVLAKLGYTK